MGRANLPETEIKDLIGARVQVQMIRSDVAFIGWIRNIYTEYVILDLVKQFPRSNYKKDLLYIMRENILFVKMI